MKTKWKQNKANAEQTTPWTFPLLKQSHNSFW